MNRTLRHYLWKNELARGSAWLIMVACCKIIAFYAPSLANDNTILGDSIQLCGICDTSLPQAFLAMLQFILCTICEINPVSHKASSNAHLDHDCNTKGEAVGGTDTSNADA